MKIWLKRQLRGTLLHRSYRFLKGLRTRPRIDPFDRNAEYDAQTVGVMKCILRRGSSAIDVGAHRGAILRQILAMAPAGVHHAFEALPHLGLNLRREFPEVFIHQAAVGDQVGQAEFLHVENDPGYSGLRRRIYDRPDPCISTIAVHTTTIDETIPTRQEIEFIKIDVEGGEYHAMRGAQRTIQRCRPVIVFEAGLHSTGQYGVSPRELFTFVSTRLDYQLSTMRRWLDRRASYTLDEFEFNWTDGPDYYFIAVPRGLVAFG